MWGRSLKIGTADTLSWYGSTKIIMVTMLSNTLLHSAVGKIASASPSPSVVQIPQLLLRKDFFAPDLYPY